MTEEQFWESNPRIIQVWAKAWKGRENRNNEVIYAQVGNYVLSALYTAIDGVLNGKKAKAKYVKEPIQLFPLTEEEKKEKEEEKRQKAIDAFMNWAKAQKKKSNKEGG
jgi:hypothetical protein